MLTQLRRSVPTKYNTASGRAAEIRSESSRLVTAQQASAIPATQCRFRFKPSKYPLQWVKEQLELHKTRDRILTLNQYLAQEIRGTRIDSFHAPINKNFKKKVNAFNPFVKVDAATTQETLEHYEYLWAGREHGKSGVASATPEQVQAELLQLQQRQADRRDRRTERVRQAVSAQDQAKQAERKERIATKKAKAREERDSKNREDDDDFDSPEPQSNKNSEFVF